MISNPVNVRDLVDRSPIRMIQYWTFATCILIAVMDGYDTAVVGVAGPALIAQGLADAKSFGYIASAGLAGFVPGMLVFGPAADRWGRKVMLAAAVVIFAAGSLLTGLSESLSMLLLSRFVTGIGVGGAAPCFVALAAEYAPQRARTTVVTMLWAGVPAGGVLGGVVAARFLGSAGWPALFYLGAVAPLLAVVLLVLTVPESIGYLAARGGQDERVRSIVRRIAGDAAALENATFVTARAELRLRAARDDHPVLGRPAPRSRDAVRPDRDGVFVPLRRLRVRDDVRRTGHETGDAYEGGGRATGRVGGRVGAVRFHG